MRTSTAAAIATLLSINVTVAEAPIDDGKALITNCKSTQAIPLSYCIGYIRGIVARGSIDRVYYCVPPGDKDVLMVQAVVNYLEQDSQAEFHYPAVMLILNAMNKAFTCSKATP